MKLILFSTKLNILIKLWSKNRFWNWLAKKQNFEHYNGFFSPQLKNTPLSICSVGSFIYHVAHIPGEIIFISKHFAQRWSECVCCTRFQSSIHKGNFFSLFRMLSQSGVSCWRDCICLCTLCLYVCTLILINSFDATVEIWTMKFDAIKAYHLIRNGIMHNNTFTSNWFVSGLSNCVYYVLLLFFLTSHHQIMMAFQQYTHLFF